MELTKEVGRAGRVSSDASARGVKLRWEAEWPATALDGTHKQNGKALATLSYESFF